MLVWIKIVLLLQHVQFAFKIKYGKLKGQKGYVCVKYGKYLYYTLVIGKCPNTNVSNKRTYANSADPDQTAPEGAVWSGSTLFAIPLCILRNICIKSKI